MSGDTYTLTRTCGATVNATVTRGEGYYTPAMIDITDPATSGTSVPLFSVMTVASWLTIPTSPSPIPSPGSRPAGWLSDTLRTAGIGGHGPPARTSLRSTAIGCLMLTVPPQKWSLTACAVAFSRVAFNH